MPKKKPAAAAKPKPQTKPKAKSTTVARSSDAKSKTKDAQAELPNEKRLLPEQVLALTRITSGKLIAGARSQVDDGTTYDVDFGVRITGQVIIGHEADFTSNNAPKLLELVQALLAQFGPRKRATVVADLMLSGIARTIAPDDKPVDGLAELAAALIDGLTTTTKGTKRGNVTGDVAVQLIEWTA